VTAAVQKPRTPRQKDERGYALLIILLFLTLMIVAMAALAPTAKVTIQREREAELIHRGTQYSRAIGRYFKKFGRYPTSIEQLENTNNIRFLRKRYTDPITGKDDWQIIHFGEAQARTTGFGSSNSGASAIGAPAGSTVGTQSPLGTSPIGGNSPSASTGSSSTGGTAGTQGTSGASATGSGSQGSQDQLGRRRFGGGAIVGVASSSEKESLKEINGKSHYNEWQFVYDPTQDPSMRRGGSGVPGANPIQPGTGTQPGVNPTPGMGGMGNPGAMGSPGPTGPPAPSSTGVPSPR
jgi:type II secretory pathway pseudopilin PulG